MPEDQSLNRPSSVKTSPRGTATAIARAPEPTCCSVPPGIDPDIEDAASENDRRWFELRRLRSWRIRPRRSGELGTGSPDCREVLVQQVFIGYRIRRPLFSTGGLPPRDDDLDLKRLAELIDLGEVAFVLDGGRVVGVEDLPGGRLDG